MYAKFWKEIQSKVFQESPILTENGEGFLWAPYNLLHCKFVKNNDWLRTKNYPYYIHNHQASTTNCRKAFWILAIDFGWPMIVTSWSNRLKLESVGIYVQKNARILAAITLDLLSQGQCCTTLRTILAVGECSDEVLPPKCTSMVSCRNSRKSSKISFTCYITYPFRKSLEKMPNVFPS